MDMDNPPTQTQEEPEKMDTDEKEEVVVEDGEATKEKKPKKKGKKEEERQFEVLSNLSRVVPGQLKYISFPEGSRYAPVKKVPPFGMDRLLNVAYGWCFDHERLETGGGGRVH
jgi:hypothetical protein